MGDVGDSDLDEGGSSKENMNVICDECVVGHVHVDSGDEDDQILEIDLE